MSHPPTYEDSLGELEILAHDDTLPPYIQRATERALAGDTSVTQVADDLQKEVADLGNRFNKVDEAFYWINRDLVEFNNAGDKDKDKGSKLQLTWADLKKRVTELLLETRNVATTTESYIKDFLGVIIPIVESIKKPRDYQDAVVDLNEFIRRKNPHAGKLSDSNRLGDLLRRDLATFKQSFDSFANTRRVALQDDISKVPISTLSQEVSRAEKELADAEKSLADAETSRNVLGQLKATPEQISKLRSLRDKSLANANQAKSELANAENKLLQYKKQIEALDKIQAGISVQKDEIDYITRRFGQFAAIWTYVACDARLISINLKAALDAGAKGNNKLMEAYKRQLELIKRSSAVLSAALKQYATQISRFGGPRSY